MLTSSTLANRLADKPAKEESVEDQMLYKLLQGVLNATRPSCCLLGTKCPSLSSAFVCLPALASCFGTMGTAKCDSWGKAA